MHFGIIKIFCVGLICILDVHYLLSKTHHIIILKKYNNKYNFFLKTHNTRLNPQQHHQTTVVGAVHASSQAAAVTVSVVDLPPHSPNTPLIKGPYRDRKIHWVIVSIWRHSPAKLQPPQSLKTCWPKFCSISQPQRTQSNRTHESKLKLVCARNGTSRKQRSWSSVFENVSAKTKRGISCFFQQKSKSKRTLP